MIVNCFLEELHILGVLFAGYRTAQNSGQVQGTNEEEKKSSYDHPEKLEQNFNHPNNTI